MDDQQTPETDMDTTLHKNKTTERLCVVYVLTWAGHIHRTLMQTRPVLMITPLQQPVGKVSVSLPTDGLQRRKMRRYPSRSSETDVSVRRKVVVSPTSSHHVQGSAIV